MKDKALNEEVSNEKVLNKEVFKEEVLEEEVLKEEAETSETKPVRKSVRILASAAVCLILLLVILTFIFACIPTDFARKAFRGLLGLDVVVPFLLWIYLYLIKRAEKTDREINRS